MELYLIKRLLKLSEGGSFKPAVINGIPVEQAGELTVEFICNA